MEVREIDMLCKELDNRIYLYNEYVTYDDLSLNVLTNSYKAYAWMYILTKNVYKYGYANKKTYCKTMRCLYSKDAYINIVKKWNPEEYEEIISHHKKIGKKYLSENGIYLIIDEENNFIFIRNKENMYFIVNDGYQNTFVELSRFVREYYSKELEKKGFFIIHSCAVEKDGNIYLLTGNKGAGKTTSLLNLLDRHYNIVSNDRVFLGYHDNTLKCLTWPGAVAISTDVVKQFPDFISILKDLDNSIYPQQRISDLAEISKLPNEYWNNHKIDKFDLSYEEIANFFNVNAIASGVVKKIICLNYQQKNLCSYKDFILYPKDNSYPDWLFLRAGLYMDEYNKLIKGIEQKIINIELNHDQEDIIKILKLIN